MVGEPDAGSRQPHSHEDISHPRTLNNSPAKRHTFSPPSTSIAKLAKTRHRCQMGVAFAIVAGKRLDHLGFVQRYNQNRLRLEVESNQKLTAASIDAATNNAITSGRRYTHRRESIRTLVITTAGKLTISHIARGCVRIRSGEAEPLDSPKLGSNEISPPCTTVLSFIFGSWTTAKTGSSPIQKSSANGSVNALVP